MTRVEMDFSDLDRWTEVLTRAPAVTRKQAKAVVSKGALQIKNEARRNAPSGGHAKHYPRSINYDIEEKTEGFEAEIGPEEGRLQRGLGNLLEYGSAHNPPHPHLEPALDHEEPRFVKAAEDLAAEAIEGG